MKKDKINDAMNKIDPKYIEQAANATTAKKSRGFNIKYGVLAASLAFVMLASKVIF